MILFRNVKFYYPDSGSPVFDGIRLELPEGIVSFIGQNGTGKSTLLLLAGGRLLPQGGSVLIDGRDTRGFISEEERAPYASFIYQNMEFESQEPVGDLLRFVYENGFHDKKDEGFINELILVFELQKFLHRKTQEISKGELQRAIIAFSLLYGSRNILMDEPIFALEDYQKHRALEYINAFAKKKKYNIYFSLHELDLSEKYSDYLVLFHKNRRLETGPTKTLFHREKIEELYQVPFTMLKKKESVFRDTLNRLHKNYKDSEKRISGDYKGKN